jgi:hypothetical protein
VVRGSTISWCSVPFTRSRTLMVAGAVCVAACAGAAAAVASVGASAAAAVTPPTATVVAFSICRLLGSKSGIRSSFRGK